MSHSRTTPKELELGILADRCAEETERFFRKQTSQDNFCFELLRRAIVLHSQAAWERIHAQYHSLVAGWVQKHSAFATCDEDIEFFVNGAWARFGRWCTSERFARLGGLPQLLASLKACIHSEIVDYHRQQMTRVAQNEWDEVTSGMTTVTSMNNLTTAAPHAMVIDSEMRKNFWRLIKERLQTEQEIILVENDFLLGYKAREICALRPDIFPDVQDVYRSKENLLRRLRRDPALRRLFED